VLDDGTEAAMWMTMSNKSYDFAYSRDHFKTRGRFHHVTYALDSREDILRAADIFLENGVTIETGPHKHAIQQTFFCMWMSPVATASKSPMPARDSSWRRIGSRSCGPKKSARRDRRGG
jgi:hypothetical protein